MARGSWDVKQQPEPFTSFEILEVLAQALAQPCFSPAAIPSMGKKKSGCNGQLMEFREIFSR